jgi:uracil-DNA glycosylase
MIPDPPADWADLPWFRGPAWPALRARLAAEPDWLPGPAAVFRALELTPRAAVRVVILGQDPYPAPGRATGLAFAFPPGMAPRDSLANILAELAADTGRPRADGDLSGWARQGVLLFNTVLSVPPHRPQGHRGRGWEGLARDLLAATLSDGPRALLLWGRPAQALVQGLPLDGHGVFAAPHPSPLSARRGFFGSRPFTAANAFLAARGLPPVDWHA